MPINFLEENQFEVDEGYSVVIGLLYRINEIFNLGLVAKPFFELEVDHEFSVDNRIFNEKAELEMPNILGAGLSCRPNDNFTVSTDLTWTDWSDYSFIENGAKKNPISGGSSTTDKLKDTFTWRLGCEYVNIIEEKNLIFPIRWGIGYDPSPEVGETDDFYTLNFGLGFQVDKFNFDVGYEYRWGNNVSKSTLQSINVEHDISRHRVLASIIFYFQ